MYKILIVDDEKDVVRLLKDFFQLKGYDTITAYSGEEAIQKVSLNPDLILLDINMPGMEGTEVCSKIRDYVSCPILFLTAMIEDSDKIKGFSVGGDDYILKPFDPLEVATRVSANLRRCYGYSAPESKQELVCGNLKLDSNKCLLLKKGQVVELTALEYRMLQHFMENQGGVLTKNQIYEAAWEENQFPDDNSIMVAISKLRSKLNDGEYEYIHTIRGLGYRMEARHEDET